MINPEPKYNPPYFSTNLVSNLNIQMTFKSKYWSFTLPSPKDDYGRTVTVIPNFGNSSSFVKYDSTKNLVYIDNISINAETPIQTGSFRLNFILDD